MLETVNGKVLEARKAGDKFATGVFQLVKAELLNNQKTDKPKDELDVVRSYAKKLGKSLEAYKGMAQFDELSKELDLVKTLLPPEASEDEIRAKIREYLDRNSDRQIGPIISALKPFFPSTDGATLSKLIRESLQ